MRQLRWQFWAVFVASVGFASAAAALLDMAPEHREGPAGPHLQLSLASTLVSAFGLYLAVVTALIGGALAKGRRPWLLWLGSFIFGYLEFSGIVVGIGTAREQPSRPDHVNYSRWLLMTAIGLVMIYAAFVITIVAARVLRRIPAAESPSAPFPDCE